MMFVRLNGVLLLYHIGVLLGVGLLGQGGWESFCQIL